MTVSVEVVGRVPLRRDGSSGPVIKLTKSRKAPRTTTFETVFCQDGAAMLRVITDGAMVETLGSSAVAITSFVSPPGATPPAARGLRVAAVPPGARCTLDAWTLALGPPPAP